MQVQRVGRREHGVQWVDEGVVPRIQTRAVVLEDAIRPVFEASGGKYGFLSGQVDPRWERDGEKMLAQGLEIAAQGPNVMVKMPGSKHGYQKIEKLTARLGRSPARSPMIFT